MRLRLLLSLLVLVAALVQAPAASARPVDVIEDCAQDGVIDERHASADLRAALRQIPADTDEYSDCRETIRAELESRAGGDGNAGGGNSGTPSAGGTGSGGGTAGTGTAGIGTPGTFVTTTPGGIPLDSSGRYNYRPGDETEDDRYALSEARAGREAPLVPNADPSEAVPVEPGPAPRPSPDNLTRAANDVPAPLLFALIAVAALNLFTGLLVFRRKLPDARRVALRLVGR